MEEKLVPEAQETPEDFAYRCVGNTVDRGNTQLLLMQHYGLDTAKARETYEAAFEQFRKDVGAPHA